MTVKTDNREVVVNMFKKNYTPYNIHLATGLGIKEVYNYVRESEELNRRHKQIVYDRKRETV